MSTPHAAQRDWLLYRVVAEAVDDIEWLNDVAASLIDGSHRDRMAGGIRDALARYDGDRMLIDGQQVMESWETPIMRAMAEKVAPSNRLLEVGFGMGLSAQMLQDLGVGAHTIIEVNPTVLERAKGWRAERDTRNITLVAGAWQDVLLGLGDFEAIFFDTYPINEVEMAEALETPYPRDFFAAASKHLSDNGRLVYYSNEIDSLSRAHQRSLLEHFREFNVSVVRDLRPPNDCNYWWADSMAVVLATR